jgi:hypothetical protein
MPIELHGGEFVGRHVTKATYDASLKAGFEIASGASSALRHARHAISKRFIGGTWQSHG